jgi:hypothetical protein
MAASSVSETSIELLPSASDTSLSPTAARPVEVRSLIMAHSNATKAPTICIVMRHAGLVVSMFSMMDRNSAPRGSFYGPAPGRLACGFEQVDP